MQVLIVIYGLSALMLAASVFVSPRPRMLIPITQVLLYGGIIWTGLIIAQQIPLEGVSALYLLMLAAGALLLAYWIIWYRIEVDKRSARSARAGALER